MPKVSVIIPVYNIQDEVGGMLRAITEQTFADFEVIVIDDGSTDNTHKEVEKYAVTDKRFKVIYQENSGVSAARNRGLKKAEGDYVVFFDGDDCVPPNALESMYKAVSCGSDMAVGIMEVIDDGISSVNKASKNLSMKVHIDRRDMNFIKTWSQCNKIYRRSFLMENDIYFKDVKVAEDGHFLYQALSKAKHISGCGDAVVYKYIRRPFWGRDVSASKNVDSSFLADRMEVYDDILKICENMFDNSNEQYEYEQGLIKRFIEGGIIQAFYRRIWRCSNDIQEELAVKLKSYAEKTNEKVFTEICEKNWDIPVVDIVDRKVIDFKKKISKKPTVSFIIAPDLISEDVDFIITGIVNQEFPNFEILVTDNSFLSIAENLKKLENIRAVAVNGSEKKDLLRNALGEYVLFVDIKVLFSIHALKKMASELRENGKIDFVSVYMFGFSENLTDGRKIYKKNLKYSDAVFGYTDRKNKINYLDNVFSNKLFRKSSIENFILSGNDAEDVREMYDSMAFKKFRSVWSIVYVSDDLLLKRTNGSVKRSWINLNLFINRLLKPFSGKGIRKLIKG
ncbi:MAG: glycosyltransferase family 2 protein [Anaerovoracaceae bacterium]